MIYIIRFVIFYQEFLGRVVVQFQLIILFVCFFNLLSFVFSRGFVVVRFLCMLKWLLFSKGFEVFLQIYIFFGIICFDWQSNCFLFQLLFCLEVIFGIIWGLNLGRSVIIFFFCRGDSLVLVFCEKRKMDWFSLNFWLVFCCY